LSGARANAQHDPFSLGGAGRLEQQGQRHGSSRPVNQGPFDDKPWLATRWPPSGAARRWSFTNTRGKPEIGPFAAARTQ
jgi:hypothetical protein